MIINYIFSLLPDAAELEKIQKNCGKNKEEWKLASTSGYLAKEVCEENGDINLGYETYSIFMQSLLQYLFHQKFVAMKNKKNFDSEKEIIRFIIEEVKKCEEKYKKNRPQFCLYNNIIGSAYVGEYG